jgi:3-methylfumaryl-CoA hydratase
MTEPTYETGENLGAPSVTHRYVEPAPVQALVSLFDDGIGGVERGQALPPLWHWVALAGWEPANGTGADGHPRTGGFLPDLGKPRRMFAGGSVEFHAPLQVGELVRQQDRVVSVVPKSGRQGEFILVNVETRLYDHDGNLGLTERRDLIYRDTVTPSAVPERVTPAAALSGPLLSRIEDGWTFRTDPTLLLRFSSATSNGHRIHYDAPYATQVEGYPGLVVHGPLMTLAMAEVLRLEGVAGIRTMAHRNLRPLFCGEEARILVESRGTTVTASVVRGEDVHSVLTTEI